MEIICQNCTQIINDNFCGNCGQKKYKRIDKKYIWDEIQYTFLHMNKGFLYSIKSIIKNPGKTAKEFVDGNRINHYKPILLAFVLSGISAFITFKIIGFKEIMANYYAEMHLSSAFMRDYMTIISSYNSIIMLLLIPLLAFFTKLGFRKWGHNYYEHIILNSYILCYYTLLNIILVYPVLFLVKSNMDIFTSLTSMSMLSIPFILIWFFKEFYPDKPLKNIIGRVALTLLFMILGFVLLMIVTMIGGYVYVMTKGPAALEYLKPR